MTTAERVAHAAPPIPDWVLAGAGRQRRVDPVGLLLLLPAAALLIVLFLGPVAYAFYLGLTNISLVGPHARHFQFTGMANITRLLRDQVFWNSLWLTVIFLIGSAIIGVTLVGMVLALLMESAVAWLRVTVGAVVVVAWMLPPVTAALIWYAFSTSGGTLSLAAGGADVLDSFPMTTICLANIWASAGFSMLILASGLRSVPDEVVEAAVMEGASRFGVFWSVKLPILRPTIVTNVLLVTLLSIANFSLIYIMTAGGPGNATNILPIYSYRQGFTFSRLSYGALLGDVLVLICTVLAYFYVRAARSGSAATRRRGLW